MALDYCSSTILFAVRMKKANKFNILVIRDTRSVEAEWAISLFFGRPSLETIYTRLVDVWHELVGSGCVDVLLEIVCFAAFLFVIIACCKVCFISLMLFISLLTLHHFCVKKE